MKSSKLLKDALKIPELECSLIRISTDDKCEISDYDDSLIYGEAKYVHSTFLEPGHLNNDDMLGVYDNDPKERAALRKQFKQLTKFLDKYKHLEA